MGFWGYSRLLSYIPIAGFIYFGFSLFHAFFCGKADELCIFCSWCCPHPHMPWCSFHSRPRCFREFKLVLEEVRVTVRRCKNICGLEGWVLEWSYKNMCLFWFLNMEQDRSHVVTLFCYTFLQIRGLRFMEKKTIFFKIVHGAFCLPFKNYLPHLRFHLEVSLWLC